MLRLLALLCFAGGGLRLAGAGIAAWTGEGRAAVVALLTAGLLGAAGVWLWRLHRNLAE
jgi:hypothetical protein